MGSLLLPDLRVDSRRGLPPGKAGRVEPRETQLARLKTDVRSRGWPRVRREAWTAGGVSSGAPTPPACLGAELYPAPPPRFEKAPFHGYGLDPEASPPLHPGDGEGSSRAL